MKALLLLITLSLASAIEIEVQYENGHVEQQESVPILKNGTYCSFVIEASPVTKITEDNKELTIIFNDKKSGLILFKSETIQEPKLLGNAKDFPQTLADSQGNTITIQGIERRIGGSITPFPLYHAHSENLEAFKLGEGIYSNNKLIGVYHRKNSGLEHSAYILPSQVLFKSLNDLKLFQKPSTSFLGLILDSNNYLPIIVSVRPNSPAAKAGLKTGDIISKLDGNEVESYEQFASNLYFLIPQKEKSLEVIRVDQRIEVNITPDFHPFSR